MRECPNHEGAFDCTPFCPLCAGQQELPIDRSTVTSTKRLERMLEDLMNLSDDLRRRATEDKLPLSARYHAGRAEAFATALFHVQETNNKSHGGE
jgi:hypothetical protein